MHDYSTSPSAGATRTTDAYVPSGRMTERTGEIMTRDPPPIRATSPARPKVVVIGGSAGSPSKSPTSPPAGATSAPTGRDPRTVCDPRARSRRGSGRRVFRRHRHPSQAERLLPVDASPIDHVDGYGRLAVLCAVMDMNLVDARRWTRGAPPVRVLHIGRPPLADTVKSGGTLVFMGGTGGRCPGIVRRSRSRRSRWPCLP